MVKRVCPSLGKQKLLRCGCVQVKGQLNEVYCCDHFSGVTSVDLQEWGGDLNEDDSIIAFMRDADGKRVVLYTQVDGEGEVFYVRGDEFVNRTGVYGIVLQG